MTIFANNLPQVLTNHWKSCRNMLRVQPPTLSLRTCPSGEPLPLPQSGRPLQDHWFQEWTTVIVIQQSRSHSCCTTEATAFTHPKMQRPEAGTLLQKNPTCHQMQQKNDLHLPNLMCIHIIGGIWFPSRIPAAMTSEK